MFRKLFGFLGLKSHVDLRQLVEEGAQIVDVRTKEEFESGHIQQAQNIPLQNLNKKASSLDKSKTVIVYCKSGMRSAQATALLKNKGFGHVLNGGGMDALQKKLNR